MSETTVVMHHSADSVLGTTGQLASCTGFYT